MVAILPQLRRPSRKSGHHLLGMFKQRPTNISAHSKLMGMCWMRVQGVASRRECKRLDGFEVCQEVICARFG
jgi:hypothetical protein